MHFAAFYLLLVNVLITSNSFATDYPYRKSYPNVNIISLTEFKTSYDKGDSIVVDVRSATEFDVIHIKSAVHLPYGNLKFTRNLAELAKNNPDKKIVVYCNGIDCIKCYKAAEDALFSSISNVYAFDAGIANWAEKYPSETLVQGKTLKNPDSLINSEKALQAKYLNFAAFKESAAANDGVVIDARDPVQRSKDLPGLDNALHIPLDKLIKNIISKGVMKDKTLYIFDQVGKQVRWLSYTLTDQGYTDFFFLEGGATTILKEQVYR